MCVVAKRCVPELTTAGGDSGAGEHVGELLVRELAAAPGDLAEPGAQGQPPTPAGSWAQSASEVTTSASGSAPPPPTWFASWRALEL